MVIGKGQIGNDIVGELPDSFIVFELTLVEGVYVHIAIMLANGQPLMIVSYGSGITIDTVVNCLEDRVSVGGVIKSVDASNTIGFNGQ